MYLLAKKKKRFFVSLTFFSVDLTSRANTYDFIFPPGKNEKKKKFRDHETIKSERRV